VGNHANNAAVRLHLLGWFFVSLFSLGSLACNEAGLTGVADGGNPCLAPKLEYACHPQDAGVPGCSPDLDSGGLPLQQEEVLTGPGYPNGCVVIVYSPVPDLNRQCSQLGTCLCGGDDAGHFNWTCRN
jgi:hypothetical protein